LCIAQHSSQTLACSYRLTISSFIVVIVTGTPIF